MFSGGDKARPRFSRRDNVSFFFCNSVQRDQWIFWLNKKSIIFPTYLVEQLRLVEVVCGRAVSLYIVPPMSVNILQFTLWHCFCCKIVTLIVSRYQSCSVKIKLKLCTLLLNNKANSMLKLFNLKIVFHILRHLCHHW